MKFVSAYSAIVVSSVDAQCPSTLAFSTSISRFLNGTVIEGLPNSSQLLVGWRTFARFWALCSIEYILSECSFSFLGKVGLFMLATLTARSVSIDGRVRNVLSSDGEYLCCLGCG